MAGIEYKIYSFNVSALRQGRQTNYLNINNEFIHLDTPASADLNLRKVGRGFGGRT